MQKVIFDIGVLEQQVVQFNMFSQINPNSGHFYHCSLYAMWFYVYWEGVF